MKCISLFLLGTAAAFAQGPTVGFTTGQAARLVIGQETFTSQDSNSSDVIVGGVSGLAYAADTLFVADSNRVGSSPNNHRVLLYQNLSGMLPCPTAPLNYDRKCPVCLGQATVVLGQPDFATTTENISGDADQPAVADRGSVRRRPPGGGRHQSQPCADLEPDPEYQRRPRRRGCGATELLVLLGAGRILPMPRA